MFREVEILLMFREVEILFMFREVEEIGAKVEVSSQH
jgi:hypothetical protein